MIRNLRKGFVILLATAVVAVASHGLAEHNSGSPDGLLAAPDAGASASTTAETTSKRAAAAAKAGKGFLPENGDSHWLPQALGPSEETWIALLAGGGLLVSLAAGGYIWWSRAQPSSSSGALVLAVKREPAAKPASSEQDKTPERRAA